MSFHSVAQRIEWTFRVKFSSQENASTLDLIVSADHPIHCDRIPGRILYVAISNRLVERECEISSADETNDFAITMDRL